MFSFTPISLFGKLKSWSNQKYLWCQNYYELLKEAQQEELQIIPHSENEHVLCYCYSNYLKIPNT